MKDDILSKHNPCMINLKKKSAVNELFATIILCAFKFQIRIQVGEENI